jgi:DNA repair protein RecO (recombination protein O)
LSIDLQAAYVLHRRVYRETSLLLDVFTVQDGRFSLVAKGVHKAKSNRNASLQAFQPLLMSWSGRGTLKTLNKLETPSPCFRFTGANLYCGFYLNELLLNLMPEFESNYAVFLSYASTLECLANTNHPSSILRRFELLLLEELGLLPQLECDWQGHSIDRNSTYYLSSDGQFVRTDKKADVKNLLFRGHTLSELSDQKIAYARSINDDTISGCMTGVVAGSVAEGLDTGAYAVQRVGEELKASRDMMRMLIDNALGGKVLKSRELIKQSQMPKGK